MKITEKQLRQIVRKALNEARIGRGTTTNTSSSWSGDEFGGVTTHYGNTEENPYSNDAVLMLANRLEKRLGKEYRVEAYANPYRSEKYDYDSDKINHETYLTKVDFVIYRRALDFGEYSDQYIDYQNIDDVATIATTAKQLLSGMAEKVYVSNVSYNGENDLDSNDSITVTALLRNVDEPRKDMIPRRRWGDKNDFYSPQPDTGYANSDFKGPESWSRSEN